MSSVANVVTVRHASVRDVDLLTELGRRTFLGAFGPDNESAFINAYVEEAFRPSQIETELADSTAFFLIAELEGTAIGYSKGRLREGPDSVTGSSPCEIERIYIDQSVVGTGAGSTLMAATLEEIGSRGCRTAWLGVWERNERAIRFYQKWGFEIVGVKTFDLGGELQTDVVMAKNVLRPGS